MIQSLHIFRKDVRHLWPELSLYALLLIAFALVSPQIWDGASQSNEFLEVFSTLLKVLIPITWLVLIVRLVHDESLVGDQQFWITRPYVWTSMLAAKLFFIAICIVLPVVIMQVALVVHAGLHPMGSIHGMFISTLFFSLILLLPFTAVAAVTATLSRAFMSVAIAVVAWAGVLTMLTSTAGPRTLLPFMSETFCILFGVLLIGTLTYQYAFRNSAHARLMLIATSVLFLGLFGCFSGMCFAGPISSIMRHHYAASTDPSFRFVFDPSPLRYGNRVAKITSDGLRAVKLPAYFEGLDPSVRLHEPSVSFTIDSPGYQYASPWRPVVIDDRSLGLLIPGDVLRHVHTSDVRMHLTFVADRLLPGTPQIVTAADHFTAPDNGSCLLLNDRPGGNLICRYAFEGPPPTRVDGLVSTQSCDSAGPTHPGTAAIRSVPPGTRPDPVIEERLQFGGAVCPGTQLTFVAYRPAGNFRLELDIPAIVLDHYIEP